MIFDVEEKDGKVFVFVDIPYKREIEDSPITGARIRMTTEDVVARLAEEKVSHGKAVQEANLFNWREYSRKGTWIFEKKSLDKSSEKVILIKEEKPAPKKRESRAKKKTSK